MCTRAEDTLPPLRAPCISRKVVPPRKSNVPISYGAYSSPFYRAPPPTEGSGSAFDRALDTRAKTPSRTPLTCNIKHA
eukprot:841846-Prorocentrum_minimum.AAC.3